MVVDVLKDVETDCQKHCFLFFAPIDPFVVEFFPVASFNLDVFFVSEKINMRRAIFTYISRFPLTLLVRASLFKSSSFMLQRLPF